MTYKGKTITKRTDGRWWARYRQDNKVYAVYGKTQKECLTKLKQALKQSTKQLTVGATTLIQWINQWLDMYKVGVVKDSTLYKFKGYIKQLEPLHSCKLKDITAMQLQKFFNAISAPSAKEHLYTMLKDVLNKAVKVELIDKNPCDNIVIKKHKAKPSKALTEEEQTRFVQHCYTNKYGLTFLLCIFEGMRIGEVQALTPNDIDRNSRTITINKSLSDQHKISAPKTDSSNRIIPLFKPTAEALDKLTWKIATSDKQLYDNWKELCRLSNISGYTIHSLRHTFATRCHEAGIAIKTVQKWLGHSTLNMTLNVYTHTNIEFEQKQRDVFDTHFDTHK